MTNAISNIRAQLEAIRLMYSMATPTELEFIQYIELGEPVTEEEVLRYNGIMKDLYARVEV